MTVSNCAVTIALAGMLLVSGACRDSPGVPSLPFSGAIAGQAVFTSNPRGCATGWSAVLDGTAALNAPFGTSPGSAAVAWPYTGTLEGTVTR